MAIPLGISNGGMVALLAIVTAAAGYGANTLRRMLRTAARRARRQAHRKPISAERLAASDAKWLAHVRAYFVLAKPYPVRPYVRVDRWGGLHYSLVPIDMPTDAEEQETLR